MRRIDLPLAVFLCFCVASCKPRKTQELLRPVQALGTVLADEAVRAAGANKNIALILPDARWGSASLLENSLRTALQSKGCMITVAKSAYLGDAMARNRVGLQPNDFTEALQNAANAGAVVSIAGAPLLAPDSPTPLKPEHPPIIVVATTSLGDEPGLPGNRLRLKSLLESKIIQLAIIDGADEDGARTSSASDSTHALFAQNYRILRAPN